MHPRVERLPQPQPDIRNLLTVLQRGRPARIPMLEIKIDDEVVTAMLGEPIVPWKKSDPPERRRQALRQHIGLMHRLGYDAFRIKAPIPLVATKPKTEDTAALSRGQREWIDEHAGPIQSMSDVECYPWPRAEQMDYTQAEETLRELPEGMGCIGYHAGVFEWASWLMGLEKFMFAVATDRETVRVVCDRVGEAVYKGLEPLAQMDRIAAIWVGDDMGFKTATMIAPKDIREFVLPWHKRFAELAHRHGKPYLLHCCGNITQIMPDMIDDVKIDAKHSFEDVIQPVEDFARQWAGKVAIIGGVDIDILARRSEEEVRRRTMQILEACAPRGGYCAGSGNSVPNYVPVDNYLAMVETVHRYNGRI